MDYKESEVGKIPVHWEIRQLSEIGEIVSGGTPNTKIEEYWNGNIPWITPKDLSGFTDRYIYSGERNITELGLENSSAKLLPRNTVLFSSRAPIGYVALAGDNLATNQGFKSIICDDKKAYPLFIYYLLKSKKNDIENIAGGSTFKEVSGKVMKEFKVQIPPLTEQKAIAHILSTLDEKIETNNQINEKLEEMAQVLFKHWFVDFEFPNENGDPYKSSGGEMVESELGMIPIGWKIESVGDITSVNIGKTPPRKEKQWFSQDMRDIRWISIKDLGNSNVFINHSTEYLTTEAVEKFNIKKVPDNTVVLSFKLTVGRIAITIGEMATNEAIAHFNIVDKDVINPYYLYLYLKDFNFQSLGSTSSIATAINSKLVRTIPVLIPDRKQMEKFRNFIAPLFKEIRSNVLENEKLYEIRELLCPKLMSGEIRVPLDNEELVEQS